MTLRALTAHQAPLNGVGRSSSTTLCDVLLHGTFDDGYFCLQNFLPCYVRETYFGKLYIRGSVHRNSRLKKSNEKQQYADIYLLLNYSTCFGRPSRPSSGVHKTLVAASDTDHTVWGASFLKCDQLRTDLGPRVHKTVDRRSQISPYLGPRVHKTVDRRSQISPYSVTLEEACSPDSMICTRGCN